MTLLLRVVVEMLILGGLAPLLVLALGRGGWHRAGPLGTPAIGLPALTGTLIAVQSPPVVLAATRSWTLSTLTLAAFLFVALLFWWPVLRPQSQGGISPIARIGYLLIAGVPVTIPGVILAFSRHLLYPGAQPAGAFGLTPLADQQLAGLVLFGTTKAILVGLTFVILWRLLAGAEGPPEDGWDEAGALPPPLPAPAWYRRLEEHLPSETLDRRVASGRVPSPR